MRNAIFSAVFLGIILFSSSFQPLRNSNVVFLDDYLWDLYHHLDSGNFPKPAYDVFERGMIGHLQLQNEGKTAAGRDILALVDFRISANRKRFWVIDLNDKEILHHTLVAHGKNTGVEFARDFSNQPHSNKSSLGFYLVSESYIGKHGFSIRLDGLEEGFNDNARTRAVVMHSAGYVSRDFIQENGRLGRSFGCPAIPIENHQEILQLLSNRAVLFLYYPLEKYEQETSLNDYQLAEEYLITSQSLSQADLKPKSR